MAGNLRLVLLWLWALSPPLLLYSSRPLSPSLLSRDWGPMFPLDSVGRPSLTVPPGAPRVLVGVFLLENFPKKSWKISRNVPSQFPEKSHNSPKNNQISRMVVFPPYLTTGEEI